MHLLIVFVFLLLLQPAVQLLVYSASGFAGSNVHDVVEALVNLFYQPGNVLVEVKSGGAVRVPIRVVIIHAGLVEIQVFHDG